ncbi:Imm49 family immunity protein [Corallococcus sp. bb12-1]|uniref:Imm49 family immunity protein n=1 Tax=Corallococcus sp. bb12-1 TaxID=2996784 RepID=UPI002271DF29|nr:Imm49 family immunity protein [Corallococcus sp. bb12-1]MCY1041534.1 Imm49 family immunity protein [Corallococcus sp. bb12-1]
MGIGWLLLLCDTRRWQSHLCRSGRAFLALSNQADGGWPVALSRSAPFFDALAALDWDCARELSLRAPRERRVELEYEEDFLYVRFLMDFCVLNRSEEDARACLARFESVLQGSEEPRLQVCQALLSRDEASFQAALEDFLKAEARRYVLLRERGRLTQEAWATDAKICVEGLALVLLAERAGMKSPSAFPAIPSVARCEVSPIEPLDAWRMGD